jgi:hypothetical protein
MNGATGAIPMTPDDVVSRHSPDQVQLKVRDDGDVVIVEGDARSLMFLAELIAAHAGACDCGFELSPTGPGNAFFANGSDRGLYLHRTHDRARPDESDSD